MQSNIRDNYLYPQSTPVYLYGHFNLKDIDWTALLNKPRAAHPDSCSKLIEIVSDFSLDQMVSIPTRGSAILDLVLSNKPDTVTNLKTIPGMSTANDHEIIVTDILCTIPVNKNRPRKIYQWKKGDIAGLKLATSNFANDYQCDSKNRTVNENFHKIQSFLLESQNKFIPTKVISGKYSYP